ncbi:unnamed protein product [Sympodiomycopsis kandeliae]
MANTDSSYNWGNSIRPQDNLFDFADSFFVDDINAEDIKATREGGQPEQEEASTSKKRKRSNTSEHTIHKRGIATDRIDDEGDHLDFALEFLTDFAIGEFKVSGMKQPIWLTDESFDKHAALKTIRSSLSPVGPAVLWVLCKLTSDRWHQLLSGRHSRIKNFARKPNWTILKVRKAQER